MNKKRRIVFVRILENKLLMYSLIFLIVSLVFVSAGNVIVKEGSVDIDKNLSVSGNTTTRSLFTYSSGDIGTALNSFYHGYIGYLYSTYNTITDGYLRFINSYLGMNTNKIYFGDSNEVSHTFNGSDYLVTAEVGTPKIYDTFTQRILGDSSFKINTSTGRITLAGLNQVYNNTLRIELDNQYYKAVINATSGHNAEAIAFQEPILFFDDKEIRFGNNDVRLRWDTTGNDMLRLFIPTYSAGQSGNLLVFGSTSITGGDFEQPIRQNPALMWCSGNKSATATDVNCGVLEHNKTEFQISTFKGAGGIAILNETTFRTLSGTGNAYACLDANGKLYRSSTACV